MAQTVLDEEVEERIEYFEDWLQSNSDDDQRSKVVSDRTAKEFIRDVFTDDGSLRNLVGGMDDQPKAYGVLVNGKYLQQLIDLNRSAEKLGRAVVKIKDKEVALGKALKQAKPKTKTAVVRSVLTPSVAEKYGFRRVTNKRGVVQYHGKNGRFVSRDKTLLPLTEKVIGASATKRLEVEKLLKRDFLGRPK